jgi:hypothetical protein
MPLELSPLTPELWREAILLHERTAFGEFNLPSPSTSIYTGTVTLDGKLVAYGSVALLAEATIVVDEKFPVITRTKAIRALLDEYLLGMDRKPDGLHAFIQEPNFASILKRKFGFTTCRGEALYLET